MAEELKTETVEVEINEEDIVGYLVDEDDNEIGVLVRDEQGNEVEVYYEEEISEEVEEAQPTAADEEVVELEIDEDDILYYFVDKSGKEIGFAAKGEDGEKVEYFYPEDDSEDDSEDAADETKDKGLPILGDAVSKEDLKDMAGTLKDVAMEGYSTIADIMDQVDDMRDSLDAINPKKRRQQRRAQKRAEAMGGPGGGSMAEE